MRHASLVLIALASLVLGLASCALYEGDSQDIDEAEEVDSASVPEEGSATIGEDDQALQDDATGISVPAGFHISIYADEVPGARSMALSESGTLFVGTRDEGKVYAVLDHDSDGSADEVIIIAEGLNSPNGVALRDGDLYVAEIGRIIKYVGIEGNLQSPPEPIVVTDDYPDDGHHGWKYIAFGPDGRLYVPVGAPCNICDPGDPFASITSLDVQTGQFEVVARGIRNTVGFDWDPATGDLWFTDNGRDWFGENSPPDELNRLESEGQHFGYPFCHGTSIPDPEFGPETCSTYTDPQVDLGPHVAALGIEFYEGDLFPEEYRGGIFIAEHGSWNRIDPIGYRVTFVRPGEDGFDVFASGWLKDGERTGRPVDIEEMPDGSLLVSDDHAGRIYRISYQP